MSADEVASAVRHMIEEAPSQYLVERLAERIGARAGVHAVFGEPVRSGETVVVPVSRVRWGFGGGGGSSEAEQASGSGGGGGVVADPIGYLVVRDGGAEYRAITPRWSSPWALLAGAVGAAIVLRALARLVR